MEMSRCPGRSDSSISGYLCSDIWRNLLPCPSLDIQGLTQRLWCLSRVHPDSPAVWPFVSISGNYEGSNPQYLHPLTRASANHRASPLLNRLRDSLLKPAILTRIYRALPWWLFLHQTSGWGFVHVVQWRLGKFLHLNCSWLKLVIRILCTVLQHVVVLAWAAHFQWLLSPDLPSWSCPNWS